jgi:hypothetical protein
MKAILLTRLEAMHIIDTLRAVKEDPVWMGLEVDESIEILEGALDNECDFKPA